jgi:hypothetical protein
MRGLIQPQLSAARQPDRGPDAPVLPLHLRGDDPFRSQGVERPGEIVAHQVKDGSKEVMASVRMPGVVTGGMNGDLRGRQGEDQPSPAGIHTAKAKDVMQEPAIGVGVATVEEYVCPGDHRGQAALRLTAIDVISTPAR